MKFDPKTPPRRYEVGNGAKFLISDCGSLRLDPDEQVTLITERGAEYDVTRKSWGFYATPSLNARLADFGLRGVLVRNVVTGRYFVFLVEEEAGFQAYLLDEGLEIIAWLDSTSSLDALKKAVVAGEPS